MVEVRCQDHGVVLAGDAAYLYPSIEAGRPSAVSVDRSAGQADIADAARRVGRANVLPGHDPAVFERYRSPIDGVAAICP